MQRRAVATSSPGSMHTYISKLLSPSFGPLQVSLGYSTSETGAAQVYDREALRLRGSAAQLNFPHWSLSDAPAAATAPELGTQVRQLCWDDVRPCVHLQTQRMHVTPPSCTEQVEII